MKNRLTPLSAAAVCCFAAFVGTASAETTYTASSTAPLNRAGSAARPAAFTPVFTASVLDSEGLRAPSPLVWSWSWNGVTADGSKFPKCTAEQIDAAQSADVCPKGSLVATAPFVAYIGPSSNRGSSVKCSGKETRLYNAGKSTLTMVIVGPGAECAGIGYLAPSKVTLKTAGGTTTFVNPVPANAAHPLPGIDGAVPSFTFTFKDLKRKAGGKTIHYMNSTRCKGGKRTFAFTTKDDDGLHPVKYSMGKCK